MRVELELKLKEVLSEKNMTQKQLSELTGIRQSTISDIIRGSRTVLNFEHISKVASELNIYDITKIMELKIIEE
ncbi:helix-turn-helix domain-containing protein [Staphylococcus epidermidis]|uniref:helix-turn-helix domain-containing protein n=1 Tax=Staphylococcus epidermidis TaxID=1282 RepID=UPI001886F26A|nr:helix-turn-helix transcriptional regulator [Staphylococcus epidermidis]MBF2334316.1 helix-turn-helix transcriptional regulator [Staphylococcus epidermidis]MBF2338392.1 helix-turn-helix transcriptional regulator [Staphylococcus epidermidis]MBF2343505.1 helix-turn-helix transcriptional regulator [Staphylococcus epidermidis]MCG1899806.1 helix-turn-helix transcriptional regulator [Staphylococcus epidermidis]